MKIANNLGEHHRRQNRVSFIFLSVQFNLLNIFLPAWVPGNELGAGDKKVKNSNNTVWYAINIIPIIIKLT